MQKNTLIWKLVPAPTTNPQALLDKFIKDKKSPTVHCANLLKTNFLELDNETKLYISKNFYQSFSFLAHSQTSLGEREAS